jgi:hypothetical protein
MYVQWLAEEFLSPQHVPLIVRPPRALHPPCTCRAAAAAVPDQRQMPPDLLHRPGANILALQVPVSFDRPQAAAFGQAEGLLLPDAARLPAAAPSSGRPVLCVELKPKCGFVTTCATVHPAHRRLKHRRSRYALHQALKGASGEAARPSGYDPLDLFSGEPARMEAALLHLMDNPQNNLMAFLDGEPVDLGGGGRAAAAAALCPAFEGAVAGARGLATLLQRVLLQEGARCSIHAEPCMRIETGLAPPHPR